MSEGQGRAGSSEERTVSYQPEERYWTDYLRIALPVIRTFAPHRIAVVLGLRIDWGRRQLATSNPGDGGGHHPD